MGPKTLFYLLRPLYWGKKGYKASFLKEGLDSEGAAGSRAYCWGLYIKNSSNNNRNSRHSNSNNDTMILIIIIMLIRNLGCGGLGFGAWGLGFRASGLDSGSDVRGGLV